MRHISVKASSIIIAAALLVAAALVSNSYFQLDFTRSGASDVCSAGDLSSLKGCLKKVIRNQVDNVEISRLITCSGKTTNACKFNLSKISRPVNIYGKPNTDAGFRRIDSQEYKIFYVVSSSGVTIRDLIFDDTEAAVSCGNLCDSPIGLSDSSNIVLDNLTITNSKNSGIEVSRIQNLKIKNSKIIDSAKFGIWMHNAQNYVSGNVSIENNLFKDNRTNAILFSAMASPESPSLIAGNTFMHNHRDVLWFICGQNKTSPCPGGQLLIEWGTSNLLIKDNVIKDGRIDAFDDQGYHASGIEFGLQNISNVTVSHNDIHNNTGAGVVENPGSQGIGNIFINGNKLYKNGTDVLFSETAVVTDNCYTAACFLLPLGVIYAEPNPCVLVSGSSTCSSAVIWSANDVSNVSVKVGGGALFSTNQSGSQTASWISGSGATFNLYTGETILDSVFVNGR